MSLSAWFVRVLRRSLSGRIWKNSWAFFSKSFLPSLVSDGSLNSFFRVLIGFFSSSSSEEVERSVEVRRFLSVLISSLY